MSTGLFPWRISLDTKALDPALAGTLVSGIQKVAPQSTLMSIPAIAASYAALVAKGTALGLTVTSVAQDEMLLKADTKKRDTAYTALLLELVGLKSLVLSNATSEADITSMGFSVLGAVTASRTRPDAPTALIVKIGKVHGKARVSVQTTGTTRLGSTPIRWSCSLTDPIEETGSFRCPATARSASSAATPRAPSSGSTSRRCDMDCNPTGARPYSSRSRDRDPLRAGRGQQSARRAGGEPVRAK